MIKREFVKLYADMNEIEEEEALVEVEEFLDTMKDMLKEHSKVSFRNFGVFQVKETKEKKVHQSWKDENEEKIIETKPRKYVKFKVSKNIEDTLYEK